MGRASGVDDTNEPMYEAATHYGLKTDRESARQFVQFFFEAVVAKLGRFLIVETVQDIPWLGTASHADRERVVDLLRPLTTVAYEDNELVLQATLLLKDFAFSKQARQHERVILRRVRAWSERTFREGVLADRLRVWRF